MKKKLLGRITVILFLFAIAIGTAYLAFNLHENSIKDKAYKSDYFKVNQIKYGLLSGDNWSLQVNRIITQQVDSFNFSPENRKVLKAQISQVLNRLFNEADIVLHKKQKTTKNKIKFKVLNALVDVNTFRDEIPRFANAIIDEIDKSKNKEQIKALLKEKVSGILAVTNQDMEGVQEKILDKYKAHRSIAFFNALIAYKTKEIRDEQQRLGYCLIGLLLFTLLLWLFVIRAKILYAFTFLFSVLISFFTLFIGISLPMIEIDARIGTLDLKLLSSHIIFKDQVIFFQTKSILDVIHILISNGKADTIFVGCLIFTFSVLFPVFKLVSASVYLFIKEKSNRFIKYMAFKSGKWSMADVMVVAIFMAYVGFQGILNNQLEDITMHDETINLITTNRSGLQTGFIIFVSFVLFNLVLAEILKYITRQKDSVQAQASPDIAQKS